MVADDLHKETDKARDERPADQYDAIAHEFTQRMMSHWDGLPEQLYAFIRLIARRSREDATPDGYAVVTPEGWFVGIWREKSVAELIVNRGPLAKNERLVPMAFIPEKT